MLKATRLLFSNINRVVSIIIIICCIKSTTLKPDTNNVLQSKLTGRYYLGFSCPVCELGVKALERLLSMHLRDDKIAAYATKLCIRLEIEDARICSSAIQEFKDEVLYVLREVKLPAKDVCALVFGDICSSSASDPEVAWSIKLPDVPKPPVDPPQLPPAGMPMLRILQLADIHIDLKYSPGSNANCKEPLCCQSSDGLSPMPADGAGLWGDYRNCDIPMWTLENLFQHLASNETFDIIYWTGDLPAHDVWNQSRSAQVELLSIVKDLMLKYFPNTPIFPALGNHESSPVNSFPPPFVSGNESISWLYEALQESWSQWLPNTTAQTITSGGYYTLPLKLGYRIVSVNTNYCNRRNWWLLLNVTDPADGLTWLAKTLQASEDVGEKVHIIGHIPPGDPDCYSMWSTNYHKIVNRYENTVVGQFFGHTHNDQFAVFYDSLNSSRAFSVAFIAPSVTTFSGLNSGYRIYTVDGSYSSSSWRVLDHETYILNISKANANDEAMWELEYVASQAYGMNDSFPYSWDRVVSALEKDAQSFASFYRYFFKSNPPLEPCDKLCASNLLCSLKTTIYRDNSHC